MPALIRYSDGSLRKKRISWDPDTLAFGACEKLESLYSSTMEPKMALLDVEEGRVNTYENSEEFFKKMGI